MSRMRFAVRVRFDDESEWGPWTLFLTKAARDKAAAAARIVGGFRTHSADLTKREVENVERYGSLVQPQTGDGV